MNSLATLTVCWILATPGPAIESTCPGSACSSCVVEAGQFRLTVRGRGFTPQSQVRWNGEYVETFFETSSILEALVVPNGKSMGRHVVEVVSGDGQVASTVVHIGRGQSCQGCGDFEIVSVRPLGRDGDSWTFEVAVENVGERELASRFSILARETRPTATAPPKTGLVAVHLPKRFEPGERVLHEIRVQDPGRTSVEFRFIVNGELAGKAGVPQIPECRFDNNTLVARVE